MPGKRLPPLQVRPELTVESDVVVSLGGTRGAEQVNESPEECSSRSVRSTTPSHVADMISSTTTGSGGL